MGGMHQYGPGTSEADCRSHVLYVFAGGMNCVSYDICVHTTLGLFVFFPWGIPQLQSDWSLSCDNGLDYAS